MLRFACIGLGRIGAPVAAHVARSGHPVTAYDAKSEKAEECPALGIEWAHSIPESVEPADVIINCVLTPADVQRVLTDILGTRTSVRAQVFIEMTTLSPEETIANAERLSARGIRYVDCPVSGGPDGALNGTLTAIVGCESQTLEMVRAALLCFSKKIFHVGDIGAGSSMKAIVQAIFLSQMASFLEALSLGRAAGLPFATQLEVLAATTSHHPTLGKRYQQILDGDFRPRFEINSALKDLKIVQELAKRVDFPMEIVDCCRAQYLEASQAGLGNEDLIALLRVGE